MKLLKHLERLNIFRSPDFRRQWNEVVDAVNANTLAAAQVGGDTEVPSVELSGLMVELTARASSEGYFEFKEKVWVDGAGYADKTGGLTHTDLGECRAVGHLPGGGMGLAYVGAVVYIRPRLVANASGVSEWEFDAANLVMPVDVTQVGGEDGTVSSPASWTYDVYAEDGDTLLSAVSPQNQRPDSGSVKAGTQGYVHYELVGGVPTLTLGLINEVPNEAGGGSGDGQGYETVTTGATTLSKTDGGVLEFVEATASVDELAVEFSQNNNDPTAEISAVVDISDLEVGGVGGSGGAKILDIEVSIPAAVATGTTVLDGDDYGGRMISCVFDGTLQGNRASWDEYSPGAATLFQKIGASESTDVSVFNGASFQVFIDASDSRKLKLTVSNAVGADRWFKALITKGARKTAADVIIS
ncbi:MAG: hypothetical protein AAGI37_18195 [Planctomycetota bacterium]